MKEEEEVIEDPESLMISLSKKDEICDILLQMNEEWLFTIILILSRNDDEEFVKKQLFKSHVAERIFKHNIVYFTTLMKNLPNLLDPYQSLKFDVIPKMRSMLKSLETRVFFKRDWLSNVMNTFYEKNNTKFVFENSTIKMNMKSLLNNGKRYAFKNAIINPCLYINNDLYYYGFIIFSPLDDIKFKESDLTSCIKYNIAKNVFWFTNRYIDECLISDEISAMEIPMNAFSGKKLSDKHYPIIFPEYFDSGKQMIVVAIPCEISPVTQKKSI